MRFQIRLLGREIVGLDYETPTADAPASAAVAEPEQQPEPVPEAAPQPQIPAGFGFHGGSGGSVEMGWQPSHDRYPVTTRTIREDQQQ